MRSHIGPAGRLSNEGRFPSLDGATGWLNTSPLTPEGLSGKVVVINFCTYTCVNWLRTLPYVRAWSERYADEGLVTVGVHTPEFSFEHDVDNVKEMLGAMRVEYPIALDNRYAVWDAFTNHYWPALYFIGIDGRIRHHQFGEGDYERSEQVIQQLLREAGAADVGTDLVSVNGIGPEAEAAWLDLQSPESYLGYERGQAPASPGGMVPKEHHVYAAPAVLELNRWALVGDWTVDSESVVLNEPNGRIEFAFHARDVHLVMGPRERGTPVPFRLTIDGEPLHDAAGSDVDADGSGVVVQQRMHQLIRQRAPVADRVFAIEFLERGAEGFAFTFG
jgi:thiol-disulfide isomerase/thioredoxin